MLASVFATVASQFIMEEGRSVVSNLGLRIDDQLIQLSYVLFFLAFISAVLNVALALERIVYTSWPFCLSELQRLNRLRYDYIEQTIIEQHDRHYRSKTYLYGSDDEEEGKNDPDIAFVNLNRPESKDWYRRWHRRILLW